MLQTKAKERTTWWTLQPKTFREIDDRHWVFFFFFRLSQHKNLDTNLEKNESGTQVRVCRDVLKLQRWKRFFSIQWNPTRSKWGLQMGVKNVILCNALSVYAYACLRSIWPVGSDPPLRGPYSLHCWGTHSTIHCRIQPYRSTCWGVVKCVLFNPTARLFDLSWQLDTQLEWNNGLSVALRRLVTGLPDPIIACITPYLPRSSHI